MNEETLNEAPDLEQELIEAVEVEDAIADEAAEEAELTIEEQLEIARKEAADNLDRYLRAKADLANARKRFDKQQALSYTNANIDLVDKLLPVLDDFERATETTPDAVRADGWYPGIELLQRKMYAVLQQLNVSEIEAKGQHFDPNFHEALGRKPSDEFESDTVCMVMRKGYQIGERVVRPALVYVAE